MARDRNQREVTVYCYLPEMRFRYNSQEYGRKLLDLSLVYCTYRFTFLSDLEIFHDIAKPADSGDIIDGFATSWAEVGLESA